MDQSQVNASAASTGPEVVELLVAQYHLFFLSREDVVAVQCSDGRHVDADVDEGQLDALLRAHAFGPAVPGAAVRVRNATEPLTGHHRLGTYSPDQAGNTKWLCICIKAGPGHSDAVADPEAAAGQVLGNLRSLGVPAYLERAGDGQDLQVWVFFGTPATSAAARELAFAAIPENLTLTSGGVAVPGTSRGVEVTPRNDTLNPGDLGHFVWLPGWWDAPEGANVLHEVSSTGEVQPIDSTGPKALSQAELEAVLEQARSPRAPAPAAEEEEAASPELRAWMAAAVVALPEDAFQEVYGPWLTGGRSPGWLECRDFRLGGSDQASSARVADGTGETPRGQFESVVGGYSMSLFQFMVATGRAQDILDACIWVAHKAKLPLPRAEGEKVILVNRCQLRTLITNSWIALHRENTGPDVFLRNGKLVRIVHNGAGQQIELFGKTELYGILLRIARWMKDGKDGSEHAFPLPVVAADMLVNPDPRLPRLEGVVNAPLFGRSGALIVTAGYHVENALWASFPDDYAMQSVTPAPTNAEVKAALALLLDELLVDFPFVDEADRAHALAALILPVVRLMIPGPTPLHIFEAPTPGSGKGLLADVLSIITTGHPSTPQVLPDCEEEARKGLVSELLTGRSLIVLDNHAEKKRLDSSSLASVLTSIQYTGRCLGRSVMLTMPNRATWVLTGNNPRLSLEIARRSIRIRIDPRMDRPWERKEFKHPRLTQWVRQNRWKLTHALLTLVQAWVAAGRPSAERSLGSFESWADTVGGILRVAGVPGFLANSDKLYADADSDGSSWREFVVHWCLMFGEGPVQVGTLATLCADKVLLGAVLGDGSPRSQQTRLGNALKSARDRVFGDYRIEACQDDTKHKGASRYRLVKVNGGTPPAGAAAAEQCAQNDVQTTEV